MNKMLVAVFNNDTQAYEGLTALKELHREGDITLYASAVLSKDTSGKVNMKQTVDDGPVGTALGMLTGSMVGLLAGPVGLAVGATYGALTGLLFDLNNAGIDVQFVDDVSKALSPGKAAVLADVDEDWRTPVDARIGKLNGVVFRRLRSEVAEDQLTREAAAFKADVQQLEEELAEAHADHKAAIQKQIDDAKTKLQVTRDLVQKRVDQTKREADAKIASLQEQLKQASARHKARIEKRIAEIRASLEAKNAKLKEAGRLVAEALAA